MALAEVAFTVFCLVVPAWSADSSKPWDYTARYGPATWPERFDQCNGSRQSPIDINTGRLTLPLNDWNSLTLSSSAPVSTVLENDGNSLKASLNAGQVVKLQGGPLIFEYQVAQFHLHFGVNGVMGSEHTIDNKQTPAELHIVSFATRYGTLANAVDKFEGLAVIGVMIKPGTTNRSPDLKKFFDESAKLMYKDDTSSQSFTLQELIPTNFANNFYHYNGSLTTPTCGEVVQWLLCADVIEMEQSVLDSLASVYTGNRTDPGPRLSGNHRPPQPLLGRTVLLFHRAGGSATGPTLGLLFAGLLLAIIQFF